ncbi:hypothetical protein DL95DRAFT_384152, partial [Leptodontidium sp. 2 PMI_412]
MDQEPHLSTQTLNSSNSTMEMDSPLPSTSPNPSIPTTTSIATTFLLFPLLPPELRLKIFALASSPPSNPIIHILSPSPLHNNYISNQPPHALLSTTHDSRATYLLTTSSVPAFRTYVSYPSDIFYFTNFARLDDFSRLSALLACEDVKFIQRFAVKRELFDRACTVILEGMKGLRELCVVWRDWRPVGET